MARFIKVADTEGTCDFIDVDQVTKVACAVKRGKSGSHLKIGGLVDDPVSQNPLVTETVTAVIKLFTAGGSGELHFSDLSVAKSWAQQYFGLHVPFDQL